jgi:hypothetical protein
MKKVRLTENDLVRIIERVIKESEHNEEFFHDFEDSEVMGDEHMKPKHKGGKVTRAPKHDLNRFMDKDDREVEFNPEGKSSSIYSSLDKFKEDHPELYDAYFAKGGEKMFNDYGGELEVFGDDDMPLEDDFEFEDSKLAEMKRRVKVMENNIRRKKQLKRK